MTARVYVHVGPHKTGTTYLQGLLMANRERLAEQGVLYPRRTFRAQGRAVKDALGRSTVPATGQPVDGEWARLVGEVQEWEGPLAVVSHEMLAGAEPRQIRTLVRSLAKHEVHVVYTARDLARVVPAMWQTALRSKQPLTWEQYAAALREPEQAGKVAQSFWQSQDAPVALQRWGRRVPTEHLHVVTVPRPGSPPELLWHRFCEPVGIDPTGHDLEPKRSNPSLGTAEAELLRRLNAELKGSGIDATGWLYWVRWLGRALERREGMQKFTLPADDLDWVSGRARQVVDGLRAGGYPVVGDLDDLLPQPVPEARAHHPSDTTPEATLDVAVEALRHLMSELAPHKAGSHGNRGSDD